MSREQEIRHECLLQLYGARPVSVTAEHIAKVAKRQGFDYMPAEVKRELAFLAGQELARKSTDEITGQERFGITSKGVISYENHD